MLPRCRKHDSLAGINVVGSCSDTGSYDSSDGGLSTPVVRVENSIKQAEAMRRQQHCLFCNDSTFDRA